MSQINEIDDDQVEPLRAKRAKLAELMGTGYRQPAPLSAEQLQIVLAVLQFNHDYYCRQGMHKGHMWPEEVATEIANALRTGIVPDRLDP